MGLVIEIHAYMDWQRVYFVQDLDETSAKEKAAQLDERYKFDSTRHYVCEV